MTQYNRSLITLKGHYQKPIYSHGVSKKISYGNKLKHQITCGSLWISFASILKYIGESATICEKRTSTLPSKALNKALINWLLTGIPTSKDGSKLFVFFTIPAVQIHSSAGVYISQYNLAASSEPLKGFYSFKTFHLSKKKSRQYHPS